MGSAVTSSKMRIIEGSPLSTTALTFAATSVTGPEATRLAPWNAVQLLWAMFVALQAPGSREHFTRVKFHGSIMKLPNEISLDAVQRATVR
jgi:hypothetical protein